MMLCTKQRLLSEAPILDCDVWLWMKQCQWAYTYEQQWAEKNQLSFVYIRRRSGISSACPHPRTLRLCVCVCVCVQQTNQMVSQCLKNKTCALAECSEHCTYSRTMPMPLTSRRFALQIRLDQVYSCGNFALEFIRCEMFRCNVRARWVKEYDFHHMIYNGANLLLPWNSANVRVRKWEHASLT